MSDDIKICPVDHKLWSEFYDTGELASLKNVVSYTRVKKTVELVAKLEQDLALFKDTKLSLDDLSAIVHSAAKILAVKPEVIRPLCIPFLNFTLTAERFHLLVRQLAGNHSRYKHVSRVTLYNGTLDEYGWHYAVLADILEGPTPEIRELKFKVVEGPAAGFFAYASMKKSNLSLFSRITGGCKREPGNYFSLKSWEEAVLFKVCVLLRSGACFYELQDKSGINQLAVANSVTAIRATAEQFKANKELFSERLQECLQGRTNPCFSCPIGYDTCPRGCRSKTLEVPPEHETVALTIKGNDLCPISLNEI